MNSLDLLGHGEVVEGQPFEQIGDILERAFGRGCMGAKMPNAKNNTPQDSLEFTVKMALARAEQKLASREKPPTKQFHACLALQVIRDDLSAYKEEQFIRDGYTVLTQLIANEISEIDKGLDCGCIATADRLLARIKEHGCVASPSARSSSPTLVA